MNAIAVDKPMHSHHHHHDPCDDHGCLVPPAEFVRLRYFFGQRLGVIDFADEQSYLVGKQRFHNLRLHGAGVVCGLRAERFVFPQGGNPNQPTTLLRVRRGAALDWCGREIIVGWDQCIDVAAWFAQHPDAQKAAAAGQLPELRLWVAVCYRECPSDPAPAPRDPCGCDAGGCDYARTREGFSLKLLTDADAAAVVQATPTGDPLLDCPPASDDSCLLLANFVATLGASAKTVTDISAPDNEIPERRVLLPTSVLQEQSLGALGGPRLSTLAFTDGAPDSGTLSLPIATAGFDLSRDPFAAPAQLDIAASRFKDDGNWEDAPAFTAAYIPGTPSQIQLKWAAGLIDGGRYRVLIEGNPKQPPVDQKMRPLTPLPFARHFRLIKDAAGNLQLAASLY